MTQMIIAGAIGLLVSIFITPWLIRKFSAVGIARKSEKKAPSRTFGNAEPPPWAVSPSSLALPSPM